MARPQKAFTDTSIMPFGRYKGRKMANVPAGFLLTIRDYDWIDDYPALRDYIDENKSVLKQELEQTLNRKLNAAG